MSALGVFLSRAVATLGGPQAAAAVAVGGIVVGAVGGGAIASGVFGGHNGTASGGTVGVYPCPNQGPALLKVAGGQQLLVTGRLADGSWLRIHLPSPGRSEGWIQATPLTVKGSIDSLPVATCAAEAVVPPPDVVPLESLTAVVNATPIPEPSAGPTPTPAPSSGPTPTPAPHVALSGLTTSARTVSYDTAAYCPTATRKVTISVKATDSSGVTGVTLSWRAPGSSSFTRSPMSRTGGTARSGTWQVTLDTTANGLTRAGTLSFYAVATGASGATARIPSSGTYSITVLVCSNTGPTITSVSSSGGSKLYWDPLGAGCTPNTTDITAVVRDTDTVASVWLYYTPPGSKLLKKPMSLQSAGKWYANLDGLGDINTLPKPRTGTLSWYIRATDGKGKSSQTAPATMTIRRCDSEAKFSHGVFMTSTFYQCKGSTLNLAAYADDADQPTNGLQVVFHWKLTYTQVPDNPRPSASASGHMGPNQTQGDYYGGTTAVFDGSAFPRGSLLTMWVVTTDRFGGTTTSNVYKQTLFACS